MATAKTNGLSKYVLQISLGKSKFILLLTKVCQWCCVPHIYMGYILYSATELKIHKAPIVCRVESALSHEHHRFGYFGILFRTIILTQFPFCLPPEFLFAQFRYFVFICCWHNNEQPREFGPVRERERKSERSSRSSSHTWFMCFGNCYLCHS